MEHKSQIYEPTRATWNTHSNFERIYFSRDHEFSRSTIHYSTIVKKKHDLEIFPRKNCSFLENCIAFLVYDDSSKISDAAIRVHHYLNESLKGFSCGSKVNPKR